jgi:hypothetical protein
LGGGTWVGNSRIGFFLAGLPTDCDLESLLDLEALGEDGNSRIGFFLAGLPTDCDLESLLDLEALGEDGTEAWGTAGSAVRWVKEGEREGR